MPSINDPRNRCLTEKKLLDYLDTCQFRNKPLLLDSDTGSGWTLLSWIGGQRPNSLNPLDLQQIAEFIETINRPSTAFARSKLLPASEACQSLPGLISSIDERIKLLQSTTLSSQVGIKAASWITNTIEPRFQVISADLLNNQVNCSHWKNLISCRIASPSDVGMHNTLRTQLGLQFIDFEYAGLDDLSKFAADWVLQPEYCIHPGQENIFIEILLARMNELIDDSWVLRFYDVKPLIRIKWCLIMLNRLKKDDLSDSQLKRAIAYFSCL